MNTILRNILAVILGVVIARLVNGGIIQVENMLVAPLGFVLQSWKSYLFNITL